MPRSELRELRCHLMLTAIVAASLHLGLEIHSHWSIFVGNVAHLLFG